MTTTYNFTERLGMRYPIIQGPFGGGYSSTRLLAAVSNAGGMGSFGAHNLAPDAIGELAAGARKQLVGERPFNLNLWVHDDDTRGQPEPREDFAAWIAHFTPVYADLGIEPPAYPAPHDYGFEQQAEAVIRARPAVFSFVFGIPDAAILAECRQQRIQTLGAATTLDEALALEAAGVDAILATGFEAGGHRPSFLRPAAESLMGTLALTRLVVTKTQLPVIAAGGIADGAGVAAALRLGAQAVQIGTAFLACEESNASQLQRDVLFTEVARLTKLTRGVTGRLARFIENELVRSLETSGLSPLPYPIQGAVTSPIKAAARNADHGILYAGQGAGLLEHHTARDLMAALVAEL